MTADQHSTLLVPVVVQEQTPDDEGWEAGSQDALTLSLLKPPPRRKMGPGFSALCYQSTSCLGREPPSLRDSLLPSIDDPSALRLGLLMWSLRTARRWIGSQDDIRSLQTISSVYVFRRAIYTICRVA
ncbi:uncharacterized protein KY384_000594 [Bacidia gigantensis]|uniref:uncharacterized protein n=1 Tax=Bacidia gigantensis TaxID=2732470 RepID=UPI001D040F2C|nr:uncharacterized protein KY384_000594 [Bacidia gigantensis]KAG8525834.1 hypothetical protein KY384_000594 [Bacidia gigantensis]